MPLQKHQFNKQPRMKMPPENSRIQLYMLNMYILLNVNHTSIKFFFFLKNDEETCMGK